MSTETVPNPSPTDWSSRIVGYDDVAPDQLLANPLNARRHPGAQRDALRAGLTAVGWVAPVIVNRTTDRMIDGHARVEEALTRDLPSVPVCYVELSEAEEVIALATLDAVGRLAVYDEAALEALLEAMPDDLDEVLRDVVSLVPIIVGYDNTEILPPDEFPDIDPDALHIEHRCPQCGYEWSGRPDPGT